MPRPGPLRARFYGMGKPLSRPDCLRQNPRCLKKGDDEEAYIEDCYVPQRSIYDTMRINEQIDQGSKISQPSRSTLGSGGGEGSTLSSNGTLGADIGGVFVARGGSADAGVKRLDERVIFDALKLTGDPQSMPSVGGVSSSVIIPASNSAAVGAAVVTKRRHHVGDKKDSSNRRSWKAFMPPTYPEFAERLELSIESTESGEKRLSGAGIPVSPLHPLPSLLTAPASSISIPPLPPYSPSPVSSGGPHTPLVSSSPALTPSISPMSSHPLHPVKQKESPKLHPHHLKQIKPMPSPSKEKPTLQTAPVLQTKQDTASSPQLSPGIHRQVERSGEKSKLTATPLLCVRSVSEEQPQHWNSAATKTSDLERDPPFLEYDQDTAPLIPPKPVFCPPTKARTWPRTTRGGKRSFGHGVVLHNLPILPPLPPLLGEDSDLDEESLYLLDPPSPFLQEGEGLSYGGLPLSPCLSQEGGAEGLLGWPPPTGELRERTASELRFEEDERRILKELEEEKERVQETEENEQLEMEEKNWQVVLKLDSHEASNISWTVEGEESELQNWETQQLSTSDYRPLLTPPVGFGGSEVASVSPYPSSEDGSVDLFLELERQCIEEEERKEASSLESALVPTPTEPLVACHTLARVEEEEEDEREDQVEQNKDEAGFTKSTDHINQLKLYQTESSGLGTDQNISSKDADDTQSWTASESYYDGDANASFPEDHTTPLLDICTLDEPLLESESSGIQTSHLDRTTLSDSTQAERRETDSDLGSGVSSEQEQLDDEVKDEVNVVHTSVSHEDRCPSPDKLDEENNNYELDMCKSNLKEDIVQLSLGTSDLKSNLGKDNEGNSCNEESDVELDPTVLAKLNSDEGMLLVMETYKDLSPVAENVFVAEDMPIPEHEMTHEGQRTTSPLKSDISSLLVSVPSNSKQSPPHSPISKSTISKESNMGIHDSKDRDSSVPTDSFVYLAVAVPSQYSQDCPPSPLVESTPPSPLPKPCSDPEEGSFLSSDSFVYLAAPERLPLVSDGGSADEDCRDLDSESETSQSGVDFVLGLMNEDSDWDSDGSRPVSVPPCQDQWEQLEPGLLYRLFRENQYEQEISEPCDKKDITCRVMLPDEEMTACFSTEVKAVVIYFIENRSIFTRPILVSYDGGPITKCIHYYYCTIKNKHTCIFIPSVY